MPRFLKYVLIFGVAVIAVGCGKNDGLLRTKGRLVKGGETFIPPEGQYLQIEYVPIPEDGKPPNQFYWADVDQKTGIFRPDGPMRTGMPPGRYQVTFELRDEKKKDAFGGKFNAENSLYVFDVDEDTEELVIDLDNPPAQSQAAVSAIVVPMGD
jgi:hypothetical protein